MSERLFEIELEVISDVELNLILSCDGEVVEVLEEDCIDNILIGVGEFYSRLEKYNFDLRFDKLKVNINFEY